MISFDTSFSGTNPGAGGIVAQGKNRFVINAFSETERESFRLDLRLVNDGARTETAELDIRWPTVPFSELRDVLYWQADGSEELKIIPCEIASGSTKAVLVVPPGRGFLCLHPRYSYEQYENFVASLPEGKVRKQELAETEKGRKLWLLSVGNIPAGRERQSIMVMARNHANESSGSYCMEGMLTWLLSGDPLAEYAGRWFDFHFLPMTNVDGVADGMARFTGLKQADLNKTPAWHERNNPAALPDPAHAAQYAALDDIRPTLFLNLHSYLFKFRDELYGQSGELIAHLLRFMPDQTEYGKVWKRTISDQADMTGGYCAEKFGSVSYLAEIAWFGRSLGAMRLTGSCLLRALLLSYTLRADSSYGWGEFAKFS
jgi:hypothetical protein